MKSMMRFACLAVFALSFAAGAAFAGPKKPAAKKNQFSLIKYDEYRKLSTADQESYLDALREAMVGVQAKDPTFAQYLMNSYLGMNIANADDANDREYEALQACANAPNVTITKGDQGCSKTLLNAISNGTYKNCRTSGSSAANAAYQQYYSIVCDGKVFYLKGYENDTKRYDEKQKKIVAENDLQTKKLNGTMNQNQEATKKANEAKKVEDAKKAEEGKKANADEPKADEPKKEEKPVRCFYAGFAIMNGETQSKCTGVKDICSGGNANAVPKIDALAKLICAKDKVNGRCPRTDSKGATDTDKGNVVCNPLLFGLAKDKQVICASGKNASASCKKKAEAENNIQSINDLLLCIPPEGGASKEKCGVREEFDNLVGAINSTCDKNFKWGVTGATQTSVGEQTQYGFSDSDKANWEETKKNGVKDTADLRATCKVLVERVYDIRGSGQVFDFQQKSGAELKKQGID